MMVITSRLLPQVQVAIPVLSPVQRRQKLLNPINDEKMIFACVNDVTYATHAVSDVILIHEYCGFLQSSLSGISLSSIRIAVFLLTNKLYASWTGLYLTSTFRNSSTVPYEADPNSRFDRAI